jgi:hypothetical protein
MAGDEIVHGLGGAAIGHMGHRRAGAAREQLGGEMRRRADALRAVIDRARMGFGISDKLGDRIRREIAPHHQRVRQARHDDDGLERGRIEIELAVEQRIGGERRRLRREQRVAVGRCRRDFAGAEIAGNAGAVLDHDRTAPARREALGEKPRNDVGATSGRR